MPAWWTIAKLSPNRVRSVFLLRLGQALRAFLAITIAQKTERQALEHAVFCNWGAMFAPDGAQVRTAPQALRLGMACSERVCGGVCAVPSRAVEWQWSGCAVASPAIQEGSQQVWWLRGMVATLLSPLSLCAKLISEVVCARFERKKREKLGCVVKIFDCNASFGWSGLRQPRCRQRAARGA